MPHVTFLEYGFEQTPVASPQMPVVHALDHLKSAEELQIQPQLEVVDMTLVVLEEQVDGRDRGDHKRNLPCRGVKTAAITDQRANGAEDKGTEEEFGPEFLFPHIP